MDGLMDIMDIMDIRSTMGIMDGILDIKDITVTLAIIGTVTCNLLIGGDGILIGNN